MILRQAFNLLTRLHSRPATLKRFGTPDIYSPIRITPSNYFRFLEGPSSIVIHGREFIIPVDTMKGHATQLITFGEEPTQGGFIFYYGMEDSDVILFDSTSSDIQTALRGIEGLEAVTVEGDFTDGFLVTFIGLNEPSLLTTTMDTPPLQDVDDEDVVITIAESTPVAWNPIIKRGDKIVDTLLGSMALDEIIEMNDIGGSIMGFRCRCE